MNYGRNVLLSWNESQKSAKNGQKRTRMVVLGWEKLYLSC